MIVLRCAWRASGHGFVTIGLTNGVFLSEGAYLNWSDALFSHITSGHCAVAIANRESSARRRTQQLSPTFVIAWFRHNLASRIAIGVAMSCNISF